MGGRGEGVSRTLEHQDQEEEQGRHADDERPGLAADAVQGGRYRSGD